MKVLSVIPSLLVMGCFVGMWLVVLRVDRNAHPHNFSGRANTTRRTVTGPAESCVATKDGLVITLRPAAVYTTQHKGRRKIHPSAITPELVGIVDLDMTVYGEIAIELPARTCPPPTLVAWVVPDTELRIDTVHRADSLISWRLWEGTKPMCSGADLRPLLRRRRSPST